MFDIINTESEVRKMKHDEALKKTMSKKAWQELQKQDRATNGFNTGTRTHKTDKHPSRARRKEMEREEEEECL